MHYEIDTMYGVMQVEWEMEECEVRIMGTAMFHTPIWTISLVIIYSSINKVVKVNSFVTFVVICDGI